MIVVGEKKLLFVFNPHSGTEQIRTKLLSIIDIFTKAGYLVTAYPTQCKDDAYNMVKKLHKEYDHIVCSGGDGTLDEVVRAYLEDDIKINLGYIPSGSTNDFANSLKIPSDMFDAANIAVNGTSALCDIGLMNGRSFVYVAAFGTFAEVSYETKQDLKNVFGHAAYIIEGSKRLGKMKKYHLKVETGGKVYEDDWVLGMVTNSRFVGGYEQLTSKSTQMDDGLLEVTLVKMPRDPFELGGMLGAVILQDDSMSRFLTLKTRDITFTFDEEVHWTCDGEYAGGHKVVRIQNIQKKIPIMLDPEYVAKFQ